MQFIHPTFLWSLLVLAIPIIIHLFNFRKYKLDVFYLLLLSNNILGQNDKLQHDAILKHYKMELHSVKNSNVISYKKNNDPKPTILFIRGSGFEPLFVNGNLVCYPFNLYEFKDEYNFVIVAKPNIPVFEDSIHNK